MDHLGIREFFFIGQQVINAVKVDTLKWHEFPPQTIIAVHET